MDTSVITYITLGMMVFLYALGLNTKAGKKFVDSYTWASVVFGTGIVLAALWFLIPQNSWLKVILAFVVAGIPMIARSLINKSKQPKI